MSAEILNIIDKKVAAQLKHCKGNFLSNTEYFKKSLMAVIWIILICVTVCGGFFWWSNGVVKDISTLQSEYKTINEKLDIIINNNK